MHCHAYRPHSRFPKSWSYTDHVQEYIQQTEVLLEKFYARRAVKRAGHPSWGAFRFTRESIRHIGVRGRAHCNTHAKAILVAHIGNFLTVLLLHLFSGYFSLSAPGLYTWNACRVKFSLSLAYCRNDWDFYYFSARRGKADIATLMSTLLGKPLPASSVGILLYGFLSRGMRRTARAMVVKAKACLFSLIDIK